MIYKTPDASKQYSGVLSIRDLELEIKLGITKVERVNLQTVKLNVDVMDTTKGGILVEDDYSLVVCYDDVITRLLRKLRTKEFKTLEYLASYVMNLLEKEFFSQNNMMIRVFKYPVICGNKRNISFELKNF